jgi:hypothetical protein
MTRRESKAAGELRWIKFFVELIEPYESRQPGITLGEVLKREIARVPARRRCIRWRKVVITVPLRNGKVSDPIQAEAKGNLALHRSVNEPVLIKRSRKEGLVVSRGERTFLVTHIPTGRIVAESASDGQARIVVEQLAHLDWNWTDLDHIPEATKHRCMLIKAATQFGVLRDVTVAASNGRGRALRRSMQPAQGGANAGKSL